ncbi:MAG: hypothetical protein A2Y12_05395 [Planctomycetes bacterium GWF2_42_9]|nr:MAG: hypothetical protein A2Y12_05395 [Planctomycetes bacterium GWF2_42_9]
MGQSQIADEVKPIADEFRENVIMWLSCVIFLISLLLGVGKLIFHEWTMGFFYSITSVVSGYMLKKHLGKMRFASETCEIEKPLVNAGYLNEHELT